jgi:hypothetical protein
MNRNSREKAQNAQEKEEEKDSRKDTRPKVNREWTRTTNEPQMNADLRR